MHSFQIVSKTILLPAVHDRFDRICSIKFLNKWFSLEYLYIVREKGGGVGVHNQVKINQHEI